MRPSPRRRGPFVHTPLTGWKQLHMHLPATPEQTPTPGEETASGETQIGERREAA